MNKRPEFAYALALVLGCGPASDMTGDGTSKETSETAGSSESAGSTSEEPGSTEAGSCSDGVVDPGEECDDGDELDGNQCSNECVTNCLPSDCPSCIPGDELAVVTMQTPLGPFAATHGYTYEQVNCFPKNVKINLLLDESYAPPPPTPSEVPILEIGYGDDPTLPGEYEGIAVLYTPDDEPPYVYSEDVIVTVTSTSELMVEAAITIGGEGWDFAATVKVPRCDLNYICPI
ncbi:MAG: hypothetical protein H6713_23475 [Myxococcales bacterium]|nr:hypothetical protein [Myxococcales bacterium]MCB9752927.1 hypothetical protein [Myxococcales bacterium]